MKEYSLCMLLWVKLAKRDRCLWRDITIVWHAMKRDNLMNSFVAIGAELRRLRRIKNAWFGKAVEWNRDVSLSLRQEFANIQRDRCLWRDITIVWHAMKRDNLMNSFVAIGAELRRLRRIKNAWFGKAVEWNRDVSLSLRQEFANIQRDDSKKID